MSKLLRLDGIGIAPTGLDKQPKWNQLFLPGAFHRSDFPNGVIVMDAAFFARIVENWQREGSRPLPVDYFHRGETGDDLPLEEKIAAGWISDLRAKPDGVWGLIGWTERARAHIVADELRYLSPTFSVDGLDRTTGQSQGPTLFGAALLNDPYLKELPRVAASASPPPTRKPATKETSMDPIQQMAALMSALGFPPDMKHEDAIAKCTAMAKHCASMPGAEQTAAPAPDQLSNVTGVISNPNLKDGTALDPVSENGDNPMKDPMVPMSREVRAALELSSVQVTKLAQEVAQLKAEKLASQVLALSDKLVAERRITPAQREDVATYAKAVGLSAAASFYGKLPAQAIGEVGVTGKDTEPTEADASAAYYAEVAKMQAASPTLKFTDACARVNSTRPELAKSISTLTKSV